MGEMSEQKIIAFMKILHSMGLSKGVGVCITAMVADDVEKADQVVKFIEANPNVSESDLLKKTQEICDSVDFRKKKH